MKSPAELSICSRAALKGHGFSRAEAAPLTQGVPHPFPSAAADEKGGTGIFGSAPSFVTGHDFSRAETRASRAGALAPAKSKLITLASILCASTLAFAQQSKPWEKIPIPPLHEFKPHQPARIELKNGIVFFLQEDHELPFIYGSVLIPGGARDEDASKAGLVDLYSMAWRTSGTEKTDGDAMDDLLEAKAAHVETAGDEDSTALTWDSLKADSDQVFALAMDLLFHPKFNQQKLRLAQQQEATGIVRRNDDEGEIAGREATKLVYGPDSPYTRQPELSTIGKVTIADLEAWHDRTLRGKLIVGISGDFDPAAMEAKLRAAFEGLPPAQPAPARHEKFGEPKPGISFIDKEDVNQSNVEIVGLGTDRRNPDVPALAVMNDILGGGFASRLFQKVRTELGLAYAVGGGYGFDYDHPGTFRVAVLPQSADTVAATRATLGEISGLIAKPVTDAEVARAKDSILNSFLFRYDTREKVLRERERLEFYGYPADYLETYKAALEKVTAADVNAAVKKYIHPSELAVLVVGNQTEIKPPLTELNLGEIHTIDISIPQPGPAPGQAGAAEKNQ
ncbi:MAG TPA: pitrilysin family protein [Terracidiphilus sp.]|nr:pitrilysin family protein [Terracidiphilus sp.]